MKKLFIAYLALQISLLTLPLVAESKGAFPDESIFHLEASWKTHDSKDIQLKDLSGKPTVVAMVYTSCKYACPMITNQVMKVRKKLSKKNQDKVRYLLVSFDTLRDTPKVLSDYKKKRKLDDNWMLLTGSESGVRQLANMLGVNYKKTPDGEFSHSNIVSLIDSKGVLLEEQVTGLREDVDKIAEKLKALIK